MKGVGTQIALTYVLTHCSTCGTPACCGGPNAAQTMKHIHCGVVEPVPEHIAKQYERVYRTWENGQEPRPSSVSLAQREIEVQRLMRLQKGRTRV